LLFMEIKSNVFQTLKVRPNENAVFV